VKRLPVIFAGLLLAGSSSWSQGDGEKQWIWKDTTVDVRIAVNCDSAFTSPVPGGVTLILYALPNGNTIEQTEGRALAPGLDWHYGIQHIAAQTRYLRRMFIGERFVVAYLEAGGLSWPRWRREHAAEGRIIRHLIDTLRSIAGGSSVRVVLTGHSGGGSFTFGFLNACDTIPSYVDRIAFLDSNYGFSDSAGHTEKLLGWLHGDQAHVLSVTAYDDREITLNGKKVLGPDGGTYRRTMDMVRYLGGAVPLNGYCRDSLMVFEGMDRRIEFIIHRNPSNEILHTRLVGEMNAYLHALTLKRRPEVPLRGPALYEEYVRP
jgi:hypothetical protein